MPSQAPVVEQSIQQLQVQALNFGYRFIRDSKVRAWYMQTTQEFSVRHPGRAPVRRAAPRRA